MIQEYKKYLDPDFDGRGYHYINNDVRGIVLEDVDITIFPSMYINILFDLHDNDVLNLDIEKSDINRLSYFLNNRYSIRKSDPEKYKSEKSFMNSYFPKIANSCREIGKFYHYIHLLLNDIVEKNPNIIYVDTDQIFHIGNININGVCLKTDSDKFDFIVIEGVRKYISSTLLSEINSKGYLRSIEKQNEIIGNIRSHIRNKKIDQLSI